MTFDADAPANSVFRVEAVRVPRLKNVFRVTGALIFGLVVGDPATAPASRRFQVRMVESGEVLKEVGWGSGKALLQDLEALTAGEFAELWLPQEEAVLEDS
ncbi:MAG: hypothetical protein OXH29_06400 [bacterium]|nr:hypothetical protein [bacterium]